MERVFDTLQRIQQLWQELSGMKPNTREYEALMQRIRILSEEYQALIETPKKPIEPK